MQVYKPKTAEKQHVLQFVSTFGHNAINNVLKKKITLLGKEQSLRLS